MAAAFVVGAAPVAGSDGITTDTRGQHCAQSVTESNSCANEGPLLLDKARKPVWLNTDDLVKRAIHCVPPRMPALARQARIEGHVLVDILVAEKGRVVCAQLISGHPILAACAMQAAKDWTFRPIKQNGKPVGFRGHLRFHFSTGSDLKTESPCTAAHF